MPRKGFLMKPRCILFDLDNTLTDRRESIANFARQFASDFADRLGEITIEQLERRIQIGDGNGYRPKEDMFAELAAMLPWRNPLTVDEIREHWYAVSPVCMQPRDGLFDLLNWLKVAGIKIGIITNGRTEVQRATISALCIADRMDTIIISEAAGVRKPDPAIFQLALNESGTEAADALYVGDHPATDAAGATNSGLTGIWLDTGYCWPGVYSTPQIEITHLNQLISMIEEA
jgi:putative hydrolase of the HAD superfamily